MNHSQHRRQKSLDAPFRPEDPVEVPVQWIPPQAFLKQEKYAEILDVCREQSSTKTKVENSLNFLEQTMAKIKFHRVEREDAEKVAI